MDELEFLHTVEQCTDVVVDDLRVITVRQNVKQSLLRGKVEPRENLLLLSQVLLQRSLADLDFKHGVLK
jgi:hypothetical protein